MKKFITKTETEVKNGIKYTTHYVNRPIEEGDPQGGAVGVCSINTITEIINYVYEPKNIPNVKYQAYCDPCATKNPILVGHKNTITEIDKFGRIGELMLEFLKINKPKNDDFVIIDILNMEIKMDDDDDMGFIGEHYVVDVRMGIPWPTYPTIPVEYIREMNRTCYVRKSAFQAFISKQNNIIWV